MIDRLVRSELWGLIWDGFLKEKPVDFVQKAHII